MFIKIIATSIPPMTIAGVRITIGALVIAAFVKLKGDKLPTHASIWKKGTIIGLIGVGIPFVLISWAVVHINSGTAAITMSIIPLSVFILAHFVTQDEKMSWKGLAGLIFGFFGIVILFYDTLQNNDGTLSSYALIAMLISAFGYALSGVLIKRYVKSDPISTSFVMLTTSALIIWPFILFIEQPWHIIIGIPELISLTYLGVLATGFTTMVLVMLTQKAGATFVSYNTYFIPIIAVFAGYIWLDEPLKKATFISISFILSGIFIAQKQKNSKN